MALQRRHAATIALCAFLLGVLPMRPAVAQQFGQVATNATTTYNMTFTDANQSVDATGRVVMVGRVTGDLPGVLTLALTVDPSGNVVTGEFAMNVSYTVFGPPDPDGDGDPSEVLVQRGVIKGTIGAGAVGLNADGTALNVSGLKLKVHSATVEFFSVTSGNGSFSGSSLTSPTASNGTFKLTF